MGAKGLKTLIVDQRGKSVDAIADPEAFKEAIKAVIKIVKADHMNADANTPADAFVKKLSVAFYPLDAQPI